MINQTPDLILVDSSQESNLRVAILDKKRKLTELFLENCNEDSIKGNIYLGTVVRVEHSLQCAFVDFGGERNGFLPFSDIHIDYYQIPAFDKEALSKKIRHSRSADPDSEEYVEHEVEGEQNAGQHQRDKGAKKYSIQEVIKRGQNVLVQVYKDSRGNKGASLTTYISLAGRYCVFMPNSRGGINVSRKISDPIERKRILEIVRKFPMSEGMGLVVRTAGIGISREELERDFMGLAKLWNEIREKTLHSKTQSLVYFDSDPIKQIIRDRYTSSVSKVIVEGGKYQDVLKAFEELSPSERNRVVQHKDKKPLFTQYGVEEQINDLLNERVELESGGYLVINQTEALVTIDVNSGKAIAEKDVESTALQINLEAAREIARQLRLRDLGGLIVIDFIDMLYAQHRKQVENEFSEALEEDRAKTQISRISIFGLLECSRQRLRASLVETVTLPCPSCCGMGRIRSNKFVADAILRSVQNCTQSARPARVEVICSGFVIQYLRSQGREDELTSFAKQKNFNLEFKEDTSLPMDAFIIQEVHSMSDGVKYKVLDKNDGCAAQLISRNNSCQRYEGAGFKRSKLRNYSRKEKRSGGARNLLKNIMQKIFG